MNSPFPILTEYAIHIAWDYLERTGQIGDAEFTSRFLLNTIEKMVRGGEHRKLLLANRAIAAYELFPKGTASCIV